MNEKEWVLSALKFYRPLQFFAENKELSDEELADWLIAERQKRGGESYEKRDAEAREEAANEHEEWEMVEPAAMADMVLLNEDKNRIWWDDGETDIWPGGEIYKKFLASCSQISRGSFTIGNIEEEWEGTSLTGVSFDWNGKRWRIFPGPMYGWIDFGITTQINKLIEETGFQFWGHEVGDQTSYIVVLSEKEKQAFEEERGWSFYEDMQMN